MRYVNFFYSIALISFSALSQEPVLSFQAGEDQILSEIAVKAYMADANVAKSEAIRRIRIQQASEVAFDDLQKNLSHRLAGIWWEDYPDLHVVVRLVGTERPNLEYIKTSMGAVPVRYILGAPATRDELVASIDNNLEDLTNLIPDFQGAWVDEKSGELVLEVLGDDAARSVKSELLIVDFLKAPVRIRPVALPVNMPFENFNDQGPSITSSDGLAQGGFKYQVQH